MRVRIVVGAALAAVLLSLSTSSFSCAGGDDTPLFDLAKRYDITANSAWLSPANDTRANLLMLLADGGAATARPPLVVRSFSAGRRYAAAPAPRRSRPTGTSLKTRSPAPAARPTKAARRRSPPRSPATASLALRSARP
ncbi:hypothetical protein OMW55_10635 [Sphingomonas sp. BN140010]|uniref:Uncharacterized protein n=1 Tax=Sphingomonas arvum TaxID=2992113 RepID=A0ABT3JGP9_9SPHN|nr:hypothetical protein [Sphingomonas sp. BN140010]MCW3798257.1 hypothetical protein [Sphingomonas sp. BN140010]